MLERGVVKAAQKFYVSLAHTEEDVARTLEVFGEALTAVARNFSLSTPITSHRRLSPWQNH